MDEDVQSPLPKSYSQANQDLFVLSLFGDATPGTFLDIGCSHPTFRNNTYLLETRGWTGLCIDNDAMVGYGARKAKFVMGDASALNLSEFYPTNKLVDYLSLNTDSAGLMCLQNVVRHGIRFKFATIEHDAYRFGGEMRTAIRSLMQAEGYSLLCPNVMDSKLGLAFEDWWIDPKHFSKGTIDRHSFDSQSNREILLSLLGFK